MPMTAPKDWNQNGCARRRNSSSPIMVDDRFADHRTKPRHPIRQPFRNVAAVKWQISASGFAGHQPDRSRDRDRAMSIPINITSARAIIGTACSIRRWGLAASPDNQRPRREGPRPNRSELLAPGKSAGGDRYQFPNAAATRHRSVVSYEAWSASQGYCFPTGRRRRLDPPCLILIRVYRHAPQCARSEPRRLPILVRERATGSPIDSRLELC